MIIKPKCRGFICTTSHPEGCYKNVADMAKRAADIKVEGAGPSNVLVIGCSSGYGLASRVVAAFTYGAKTVGISYGREATEKRTATAGRYNNEAFDELAKSNGIACATVQGDAYSNEAKDEVIEACRQVFAGEKIDLVVYSLASPRRTDPKTQEAYSSVIKPIGEPYHSKTVDFHTGKVSDVAVEPATEDEIANTVKVMGGEDWELWIDALLGADLLAKNCSTVAFSYIGPTLTHPVYKDGTIGKAKEDLLACRAHIESSLEDLAGTAFVSVNKALVTQSSSAIPVVPLYISLLYKIMKEKGLHEDCLDQAKRLFKDKLYASDAPTADEPGVFRLDDWEMRDDVQQEISEKWPMITTDNAEEMTDLAGYRDDFFALFGFGRSDVDYDRDVTDF